MLTFNKIIVRVKELLVFSLGLVILISSSSVSRAEKDEITPDDLYQEAYFLVREASKAHYQKAEEQAYRKYLEAVEIFKRIARQFPDWKSGMVRAGIKEYQSRAAEIGEGIFHLPEGYIKIRVGMVREGKRYRTGEALRSRVKKSGEDQYEVKGHTVTLVRAGPKVGASCDCPDFKYRGSKYDYACKHIWAVIFKEKLLEQ